MSFCKNQRVMYVDANQLRSDGQPHIPAYRDMRGTVLGDVKPGYAWVRVQWDCDGRDQPSLVQVCDLALAD